ncbi:UPF0235 protein C15orf40 homolog isoform X1 [Cololabis saira]|uniref:UPF0235 protein C15orf40 homolog isoform X1 n=1 Tax=Cololabis saira TaxID=129043 RepID=UPI002AD5AE25|nr:UPF0235 protein C15orf40 homolog isoform X1 [Cololabis saira]
MLNLLRSTGPRWFQDSGLTVKSAYLVPVLGGFTAANKAQTKRLTGGCSTHRPMPKKKVAKGQSTAPAGGAADTHTSGPVTRDKNGAVTITVHAKPGSKHSSITDVSAEAVGIAIAAPPTDGEANAELIRYLAEALELKKSHISLDKGSRSRDKLIKVDSSLSPEEVLRRLRQAAG